jgi:hypothetical protein
MSNSGNTMLFLLGDNATHTKYTVQSIRDLPDCIRRYFDWKQWLSLAHQLQNALFEKGSRFTITSAWEDEKRWLEVLLIALQKKSRMFEHAQIVERLALGGIQLAPKITHIKLLEIFTKRELMRLPTSIKQKLCDAASKVYSPARCKRYELVWLEAILEAFKQLPEDMRSTREDDIICIGRLWAGINLIPKTARAGRIRATYRGYLFLNSRIIYALAEFKQSRTNVSNQLVA